MFARLILWLKYLKARAEYHRLPRLVTEITASEPDTTLRWAGYSEDQLNPAQLLPVSLLLDPRFFINLEFPFPNSPQTAIEALLFSTFGTKYRAHLYRKGSGQIGVGEVETTLDVSGASVPMKEIDGWVPRDAEVFRILLSRLQSTRAAPPAPFKR